VASSPRRSVRSGLGGRGARPEGPRRRGVLGEGAAGPPPHQLGVWGSAVSLPSGVRVEAPAAVDFGAF